MADALGLPLLRWFATFWVIAIQLRNGTFQNFAAHG
jgi:hypothetical protein